jgi:hypothetical protein
MHEHAKDERVAQKLDVSLTIFERRGVYRNEFS